MTDKRKGAGERNQAEGTADELKGRLHRAAGAVTGNDREELKGRAEELKGKAQRKIGEVQDDADRDA